jgi:uncharacterized protein YhbP (UPF0306 family)
MIVPENSCQPALPARISAFLHEHHVVGLATVSAGMPWAASCFHAFDASSVSLLILTSEASRHGLAMLEQGLVAGTVAGQPTSIAEIRGIQFVADVQWLKDAAADEGYRFYCARHPIARLRRESVWRLSIRELKYTDNATLFGSKTLWSRDDGRREPAP